MHFSIDRTVHTTAFDKPVVDHWLERKIAAHEDNSSLHAHLEQADNVIAHQSWARTPVTSWAVC